MSLRWSRVGSQTSTFSEYPLIPWAFSTINMSMRMVHPHPLRRCLPSQDQEHDKMGTRGRGDEGKGRSET